MLTRKIELKIGLIIFSLLCWSCKTLGEPEPNSIIGSWERQQDEAKGDVVTISYLDKDQIEGRLTTISSFSASFGYKMNDVKWRLVEQIDEREFIIDNLNSEQLIDSKNNKVLEVKKFYSQFKLTIISEDEIHVEAIEPITGRLGNVQVWKRLELSDE